MRGIKYVNCEPTTGYGRAACEYMRQLVRRSIPLTWTPMVVGHERVSRWEPLAGRPYPEPEFGGVANRLLDYDLFIVHALPESMPRWREEDPRKTSMVVTVWKLDRLQQDWPGILNRVHGAIVPCAWNREVFRAGGMEVPMAVIPHLAPEAAPTALPPLPQVNADNSVLYTMAAWRERNRLHLTLEAYLRAFPADDPIALTLKMSRFHARWPYRGFWSYRVRRHFDAISRQIAQVRRKTGSTARVAVLLDELTEGDIVALHAPGDALRVAHPLRGLGTRRRRGGMGRQAGAHHGVRGPAGLPAVGSRAPDRLPAGTEQRPFPRSRRAGAPDGSLLGGAGPGEGRMPDARGGRQPRRGPCPGSPPPNFCR